MKKTRVLVLAGGQSEEHEVSIASARSVLAAVADSPLDATAVVITRRGQWLPPAESRRALTEGRAVTGGELTLHQAQVAEQFDVVFPLIHGPHGEDGTLQGMLELAGLPYVGSGVLASALCMDKPMAKTVLASHNIPQLRYSLVTRAAFAADPARIVRECSSLRAPWFVKPANLGSSVGISKAADAAALRGAIETALRYDRRVIVEEAVLEARELEVGILGNDEPAASPVGEITYASEFYDYETKYTDGRAVLHIPADIPAPLTARVQELGVEAFRLLDCAGFARVDFLYEPPTGQLLFNEVNTIPGFTPTSMFAKLWEHAGTSYSELVQRLVQLAVERHPLNHRGAAG